MNKLNKVGSQMLEYKSELNNDYPDIVINSLHSMIDKLAEDGVIDVDVHLAVKEKSITLKSLKELLLNKPSFVKTYEELFYEYEQIRAKINEILEIDEENLNEVVKTVSSVNNEKIAITKEFILTEDFIKEYFYVKSEKDYEVLMQRKGFVEKFAILRLDKILRDFKDSKKIESKYYEVINSNVFFEAERNIYGIHLLFNIPVNNLENEDDLIRVVNEIKDIMNDATIYFDSRMTV